jgi:lysophospholipase L1-like esterase
MPASPTSATLDAAIKVGEDLALKVLEYRLGAIKTRAFALEEFKKDLSIDSLTEMKTMPESDFIRNFRDARSRGTLMAEGDSWFDYPWKDVLSCLEDEYGYDVESVAHNGDHVEHMAYDGGQLVQFLRRLERLLLRQNKIPKAVLLSGGGNDFAGREFGMILNHKLSPLSGLNSQVVDGVIERIFTAYGTILSEVTTLCNRTIGRNVPILIHGYDYPVPDGRGFLGGWGPFPGPWLEPGFREKGFDDLPERMSLARVLVDKINDMLQSIVGHPEFSHVIYINLRGTLRDDLSVYQEDWANELHPSSAGFSLVSNRFAEEINLLP